MAKRKPTCAQAKLKQMAVGLLSPAISCSMVIEIDNFSERFDRCDGLQTRMSVPGANQPAGLSFIAAMPPYTMHQSSPGKEGRTCNF